MPKLKVAVDTTAQPSQTTLTTVQDKAKQVAANNVVDATRDISGKVVQIEVDLPESVDNDIDFDGDVDPMETHARALNASSGVQNCDHFPYRHIKDRSFEKAAVGATPIQWGGAQAQDLSGGTFAVSDDAGKACHQNHSLKAVVNATLGAKVNWEHISSTKNAKIMKEQQFGFSIMIPTIPSGTEIVVSTGCSPQTLLAAIVLSDGTPS